MVVDGDDDFGRVSRKLNVKVTVQVQESCPEGKYEGSGDLCW